MSRIRLDPEAMHHSAEELKLAAKHVTEADHALSLGLAAGAPPQVAAAVTGRLIGLRNALDHIAGDIGPYAAALDSRASLAYLMDHGGGLLLGVFPQLGALGLLPFLEGSGWSFKGKGGWKQNLPFHGREFGTTWERGPDGRMIKRKLTPEELAAKREKLRTALSMGASKDWFYGLQTNGEFNHGPLYGTGHLDLGATATASANVAWDGDNLSAEAGGEVRLGASARGEIGVGNDLMGVGYAASGFAGARAGLKGTASFGKDGAHVGAKADAFAGVEADLTQKNRFSGVTSSATAGVSAGIGAHASANAEVSLHKVHVKYDVGAALGVGLHVSADVSVDPVKTAHDAVHAAESAGKFVSKHVPHIDLPKPHIPHPHVKFL